MTRSELLREQSGLNTDSAEQLLDEAIRLMEFRETRMQTAEGKATTLMGTVAIAASLLIAGAGLILDKSKVTASWRDALIAVIAVLLFFLLMCGYVASRALLKVHRISRPQTRAALSRATQADSRVVMLDRAVDLLARAGENLYVADYKLAQVRVAYRWYQLALLTFLVLGLVLVAYVAVG